MYVYHDRILEIYEVSATLTNLCRIKNLGYWHVYNYMRRNGVNYWKGPDGQLIVKAKKV